MKEVEDGMKVQKQILGNNLSLPQSYADLMPQCDTLPYPTIHYTTLSHPASTLSYPYPLLPLTFLYPNLSLPPFVLYPN